MTNTNKDYRSYPVFWEDLLVAVFPKSFQQQEYVKGFSSISSSLKLRSSRLTQVLASPQQQYLQ